MRNQQFVVRILKNFLDANNRFLDVKRNNNTHSFLKKKLTEKL